MNNILIEFSSDTKGIQTADQAVQGLTKGDKAMADQFIKTNASIKEREKLLDKAGGSVASYADKLKAADKAATGAFGVKAMKDFEAAGTKAFAKLVTGSTAATRGLKGLEAELQAGVNEALKEAGVSAEEFEAALAASGITAEEFADQLLQGATGTEQFDDAMKAAENTGKSLKSQLRALKDELAVMEQNGQEGTEQFQKMAIAAARLEDQIGDTAERVRVLSSDTAGLDAAVEGVRLLSAGFQLASGAAALFGVNEEDLQKTLVKLNAIMAITQGLQEAQNFLRGQSILKLKLESFAQEVYAVAVGTSTGALKALRVALLATGIGAAIAIIYLAVEAFNLWSSSVDNTTESLESMNTRLASNKEALEDYNNELDRGAKIEAAILKNRGASEVQLLEAQLRVVRIKNENARAAQAALDTQINEKHTIDGLSLSYAELNTIVAEGGTEKSVFSKENIDKAKAMGAAVKEAVKNVDDLDTEFTVLGLEIDKAKLDAAETSNKKVQESNEKARAKNRELEKANQAALNEIIRLGLEARAEFSKEVADNESLGFEVRNNAARDYLDLQREMILNEAAIAKAAIVERKGLTSPAQIAADPEIQLAELKKTQALEKINAEAAKRIYDIWKAHNQNLARLMKAPEVEDATKEQMDKQFAMIKQGLDAQEHELDESNKRKAEKEKQAAEIRRAVAGQVLANFREASDAIFEIGAQRRQQALDSALQNLNKEREAELESKNLTEANKEDINKKYAQKERQLKLRAFEEDKKAKRAQAIINGLLGITNAIATAPTIIAGIILAAGVAVSTAIQVAKISATQPGFKKGGYTGNKRTDEVAGVIHGKEYVAHAEATAKYRPALEAINSMKFEEYLEKHAAPRSMTALPEWALGTQTAVSIDYDELGRSVARHAAPAARMEMKADEHGFSMFLIEKSRQVQIQNKYYKA